MNIIKLCVGVSSVEELLAWRADRKAQGLGRPDGLNVHRTRMTPKRGGEIAGKGSLYWVIAGAIRCRQRIVGFEAATDAEGRAQCHILLDPEVVRTMPWPRRPFQGWRYLEDGDAPPDLVTGDQAAPPDEMAAELAELGLL